MAKYIPKSLKPILKKIIFPIPKYLSRNIIRLDQNQIDIIRKKLLENYYVGWRKSSNYSQENFNSDLDVHLIGRLESDRREIIPWLDNSKSLNGQKILEIGCGTGSSSIALGEQNAEVTGIDIDQGSIEVAKEKAKVYNLKIKFICDNSNKLKEFFKKGTFDHIIFFASLEHMTLEERLNSLSDAWGLLNKGGLLTVIETPNRLWYFDGHTSMMPFYHWLPDDLAFKYSKFSKRQNFNNLYKNFNDKELVLSFLRRGRGFSFHEFELAISKVENLEVISSLSEFQGLRYDLRVSSLDRDYKKLLKRINKNIHQAFFDKFLYLTIRKT